MKQKNEYDEMKGMIFSIFSPRLKLKYGAFNLLIYSALYAFTFAAVRGQEALGLHPVVTAGASTVIHIMFALTILGVIFRFSVKITEDMKYMEYTLNSTKGKVSDYLERNFPFWADLIGYGVPIAWCYNQGATSLQVVWSFWLFVDMWRRVELCNMLDDEKRVMAAHKA
jgi:hypothetical protein